MAECNPRPKPRPRGRTYILEVRLFQRYYAEIVEAIQNPDSLADHLFSDGILEQEIKAKVHAELVPEQKSRALLNGVTKAISSEPSALYKFLKILKAQPTTEHLAKSIVSECNMRMLLIGIPGQGKSTFGNLLVRQKVFQTGSGMAQLTTEPDRAECESPDGATATITDIPGFELATTDTEEVARSLKFAAGSDNDTQAGVNVLLYAVSCRDRFGSDHQLILEFLHDYGTDLWQSLIVIFTHAAEFGTTPQKQRKALLQMSKRNNTLRWLLDNVDQQYLMFENEVQDETYRDGIVAELWNQVMQIRRKMRGKLYTCTLIESAKNASQSEVKEMLEGHITKQKDHISQSTGKEQRGKKRAMLNHGVTALLHEDSFLPSPVRKMGEYALSRCPGVSKTTDTGNTCTTCGKSSAATGKTSTTGKSSAATGKTSTTVNSNNSYNISCFPKNAIVLTTNGDKSMRDLTNGEKILCLSQNGTPIFSEVITFIHHEPNQSGEYLTISTEQGTSITLSPNHLTFIASSKPGHPLKTQPMLAANVRPGHYLVSCSAELHQPVLTEVASVCTTVQQGVYAPLTRCGLMLVNGIMASCYANTEKHSIAHCAFAPVRMYTSLRIRKRRERRPKHGVHCYAKFLIAVSKFAPKSVCTHV